MHGWHPARGIGGPPPEIGAGSRAASACRGRRPIRTGRGAGTIRRVHAAGGNAPALRAGPRPGSDGSCRRNARQAIPGTRHRQLILRRPIRHPRKPSAAGAPSWLRRRPVPLRYRGTSAHAPRPKPPRTGRPRGRAGRAFSRPRPRCCGPGTPIPARRTAGAGRRIWRGHYRRGCCRRDAVTRAHGISVSARCPEPLPFRRGADEIGSQAAAGCRPPRPGQRRGAHRSRASPSVYWTGPGAAFQNALARRAGGVARAEVLRPVPLMHRARRGDGRPPVRRKHRSRRDRRMGSNTGRGDRSAGSRRACAVLTQRRGR